MSEKFHIVGEFYAFDKPKYPGVTILIRSIKSSLSNFPSLSLHEKSFPCLPRKYTSALLPDK